MGSVCRCQGIDWLSDPPNDICKWYANENEQNHPITWDHISCEWRKRHILPITGQVTNQHLCKYLRVWNQLVRCIPLLIGTSDSRPIQDIKRPLHKSTKFKKSNTNVHPHSLKNVDLCSDVYYCYVGSTFNSLTPESDVTYTCIRVWYRFSN